MQEWRGYVTLPSVSTLCVRTLQSDVKVFLVFATNNMSPSTTRRGGGRTVCLALRRDLLSRCVAVACGTNDLLNYVVFAHE